jgi:hypothetical protein
MSQAIQEEIIQGREPTDEERELVAWTRKAREGSLRALQESLRHLVTLNTTLLAGSTAFFTQVPAPTFFKAAGSVLFMGSLCLALWGSMPREATLPYDPIAHEDVRAVRDELQGWKSCRLKWSAVLLAGGFVAFLAGLAARTFFGLP